MRLQLVPRIYACLLESWIYLVIIKVESHTFLLDVDLDLLQQLRKLKEEDMKRLV